MLQGPVRIWEGAVWKEGKTAGLAWGQGEIREVKADTWGRYQLGTGGRPQVLFVSLASLACPCSA